MLAITRDAPRALFGQVVHDLVLEGPRLAPRHLRRVEQGVLAQEELDGALVLAGSGHELAQLSLLAEAQLAIGFRGVLHGGFGFGE